MSLKNLNWVMRNLHSEKYYQSNKQNCSTNGSDYVCRGMSNRDHWAICTVTSGVNPIINPHLSALSSYLLSFYYIIRNTITTGLGLLCISVSVILLIWLRLFTLHWGKMNGWAWENSSVLSIHPGSRKRKTNVIVSMCCVFIAAFCKWSVISQTHNQAIDPSPTGG